MQSSQGAHTLARVTATEIRGVAVPRRRGHATDSDPRTRMGDVRRVLRHWAVAEQSPRSAVRHTPDFDRGLYSDRGLHRDSRGTIAVAPQPHKSAARRSQ
ncbi:hypothetical protein MBT84_01755 [Streptomyces sp. MBT84]|nr:hypothetical protein [Streptomyces sp. MBT84]